MQSHKVNKVYGKWVNELKDALKSQTLDDDDTLTTLVRSKPLLLTKEELQKLHNSAFKAAMNDHGRKVDLNWAGSLFKRFWGLTKQAQQNKQTELLKKKIEHLDYLAS